MVRSAAVNGSTVRVSHTRGNRPALQPDRSLVGRYPPPARLFPTCRRSKPRDKAPTEVGACRVARRSLLSRERSASGGAGELLAVRVPAVAVPAELHVDLPRDERTLARVEGTVAGW